MPYVSGGLYGDRVTVRIGLRTTTAAHARPAAPGEEVGRLGTRANWRSWAFIVNESLEHFCATGAFLCNGWHFCATSGVCVLHSILHRNRTTECDSSKATYDPTLHETVELKNGRLPRE